MSDVGQILAGFRQLTGHVNHDVRERRQRSPEAGAAD